MKTRGLFKRAAVAFAVVFGLGLTATAAADFIDTTGPTGSYYRYSLFSEGLSAYLGGGDVDTYGNTIYVNRDGTNLDVYNITLNDTDGDGVFEPDQHPDNVGADGILGTADDAVGPVEDRTLSYTATHNVPLMDTSTVGELYATDSGVYFLGQDEGDIYFYDVGTSTTSKAIDAPTFNLSQLGYDDVNDKWYASNEQGRTVYSYTGGSWINEFSYSSLAGSHMDGLEVVTDPDSGIPYVYVSDMTSDYLGQWYYDSVSASWMEQNLFEYDGAGAGAVEGMGFGALGHFWMTTGFAGAGDLYEVGGGSLGGYVPQDENGHDVPEPGSLMLLGGGLLALGFLRRRRSLDEA